MNNVLSIIIAVIGIAALFYAGYKVYQIVFQQEELAARETLKEIISDLNSVPEGKSVSFPIRGVNEWAIGGWSRNNPHRPEKCFNGGCICVCPVDEGTIGADTRIALGKARSPDYDINSDIYKEVQIGTNFVKEYNLKEFSKSCDIRGFCELFAVDYDLVQLVGCSKHSSTLSLCYLSSPIFFSKNLIEINIGKPLQDGKDSVSYLNFGSSSVSID